MKDFAISIDRRLSRVRFLSGNAVKIIACITMFIDHLSKMILFPWWSARLMEDVITWEQFVPVDEFIRFTLYGVGTIAFPLFCLLLTEGFQYTHDRKRYLWQMLFFALISELPFDLGFFRRYARFDGTFPFYWGYQNVYFTLFLGISALWCLDKFSYKGEDRKQKVKAFALQILSVIAACVAATLISSDYGGQGIVFIVGLYLARKSRLAQSLVFLVLYIATTGNQPPVYTMIAALIILLYNGKRGRKLSKYFFYWFYPGHIFVLYLISLILGVTL